MSEQNKALFRRVTEEIWDAKNPDLIGEIYAEDSVLHTPIGDFNGLEGYREIYDIYTSAFPDCKFDIGNVLAEGDKVMFQYTFNGTHKGELMEIAPTDAEVSVMGIALGRIAGGKIVEEWAVWDQYGLIQQLTAEAALA